MTGHATAHTILCDRCGGTIPLDDVPPSVECPFCRHVQPISEAQRTQLAGYQRDVGSALERAQAEHSQAEQWDRWYGGRGGRSKYAGWGAPVLFIAMLVPAIGVAWILQTWMTSGHAMPAFAGPMMAIVPMGFFVLVYGAYLVWFYGGRSSKSRRGAASAIATCPQCGAPNALAPGRVTERCSHCGASLLPSATLMRAGLSAAEAAERAAAMQRYRAERAGMASLMRMSIGGGIVYIIAGSFLPITVGGAIMFFVDALQHGTKEPGGLVILWCLATGNVGVMALVALWRGRTKRRWAAVLEAASRPFDPRILARLDDIVAWLNAYWPAPVALEDLTPGPYFRASALAIGEQAGLLVLNPIARSEGTPAYVSLFLAAWIPSLHGRGSYDQAALAPQRATLERLGFHLSLDAAGLHARGGADTVRHLVKDPNAGAALARIATTMGEAARLLGALRVDPLT